MLGQLSGFLFGGAESPSPVAPTTACRELHLDDPELDEWVMVADGASPVTSARATPTCSTSPSTPTSQLTVDDNWTLTPAACFPARGGPPLPPASSLENLLIEHPSMSVYVRGCRRRPARSPSPAEAAPAQAAPAPRAGQRRPGHTLTAAAASAAQLQRLAIQQAQKQHVTRRYQKLLRPATLERSNRARQVQSSGNGRPRRQHHYTTQHSGANNNRKC